MAKSPLLGVDEEKKEPVAPSVDDVSDELEDSEDEDEESDEDSEDEDEEVESKPAKRAPRKPNSMAGTGTLGDARVDPTVPLSSNARLYMAALLKSPLMAAIVPPDMLNEAAEHVFCINSLRLIVPKGRIIQVPMLLAQEIAQSFKNRV